jgi:hypothetical protein
MTYFTKYNYTIIRKHWVVLLFKYLKTMLLLILSWILFFISTKFWGVLWDEIVYLLLFPSIFILVNYAFFKLLLWYIKFYNDLLIVYDWQLIVIKSSLLFKDDIEFIDINKITKLDTYCRWLIPNIFQFWNLVVEQQRDQVREFHFIPEPFKALQILKEEKQRTIDERKNTYLIDKTNKSKKKK